MPSVRMTEDEIWSFVEDRHTGIFTTLRSDGIPIALPVWYACLDRRIYMRTRGKKLARVRNDPRSSFLVEEGEAWKDLRAVHLTGRAELVAVDGPLADRLAAEWARKYAGSTTARSDMPKATADAYANAVGGIVRFDPDDRVLNWDNRKLTQQPDATAREEHTP